MKKKVEYRREFFDRDYTLKEAYGRVWKHVRKYRFRLFVGVVCGMLTAGTLVPLFQIVQPALQHVESHDEKVDRSEDAAAAAHAVAEKETAGRPRNAVEKQIEKNSEK